MRQVAEAAGDNGKPFADAADTLAEWQGGKVKWFIAEEGKFGITWGLGPDPTRNRTDMQIAVNQPSGDFMMTAFHEVQHLESMMGLGHGRAFRARCRAAYDALPAILRSPSSPIGAPGHARPGNRQGC